MGPAECASTPCLLPGASACVDGNNTFICTCNAGYSGVLCQTNIDECGSGPCANGGSCTDLIDAFACGCQPGYSGLNCETDIDECASGPCVSNGSCVDGVNGFTCICPAGFSGVICTTDIDGTLVGSRALQRSPFASPSPPALGFRLLTCVRPSVPSAQSARRIRALSTAVIVWTL
jgi:hypothetical protein